MVFTGLQTKTFPNFSQHSVELFPRISHALVKQFTSFFFFFTTGGTVKERKIFLHGFHMFFKVSL